MSETIIAAIIGACSAIIVALISRKRKADNITDVKQIVRKGEKIVQIGVQNNNLEDDRSAK